MNPPRIFLPFILLLAATACEVPAPPSGTSFLDQAAARAEAVPRMTAFLVWHDGNVEVERYHAGGGALTPGDVKSVSKSFLSALVGIAIQEGYLRGEDQRVSEIIPEYFPDSADLRKRDITIGQLLSMHSGLHSVSGDAYADWARKPDLTRAALDERLDSDPGAEMVYSTGNTQILSSVLTRATGMSTLDFARRELGDPLGIQIPAWPRDSAGTYLGGNEMELPPAALLRLGITYLDHGKFEGRQVVPPDWVDKSLVSRGRSPDSGFDYGYGWWMRKSGAHDVFFAWGYGGQFIFCVPDLRLVAVFTAAVREGGDDDEQLRQIHDIVDSVLVPGYEQRAGTGTTTTG